jgi:hypothetical protein
MKLNRLSLILAFGLLFSCSETKEASLEDFSTDDDVFASGEALIALAFGLHALETTTTNQKTLLIGVTEAIVGAMNGSIRCRFLIKTLI